MTHTPTILVTGATSGLGRETVLQLSARGAQVHATGRRTERLAELELQGMITGHALDLTSPEAIAAFCETLGPLDGLILNAGVTFADDFSKGDYATDAALVQTNVLANLQIIRLCLPRLTESQGRILLVASLGGLTPVPYQAVYAGSKAFIVNFGISLREELATTGVRVGVFAPGGIATEMTDIPAMSHLKKNLAPVEDIAAAAIKAYDDMPAVSVPGAENKLVAVAGKLLPRGFMAKQARKIYRRQD